MGTLINPTLDDTVRVMQNNQYLSGGLLVHPVVTVPGRGMLSTTLQLSYAKAHQPADEGKVNKTAYYEEKVTTVSSRLEPQNNDYLTIIPAIAMLYRTSSRFSTSLDEGAGASHAMITEPNGSTEIITAEKSLTLPVVFLYRPESYIGVETFLSAAGADINPVLTATDGGYGDWHSSEAALNSAVDVTCTLGRTMLVAGGSCKGVYSTTEGGLDGYTRKTVTAADTLTALWSVKGALAVHLLDSAVIMFVNGGRFSNQPSLQQRYGARGAYNPNPTLRPEWGYKGECGIKYSGGGWYTEICGFYNRSYDKILTVFDGRQSSAINCSGARVYGVETVVNWKATSRISGESGITLQSTRNLAREYNWYNRRLPNEPELTINEAVTLTPAKWLTVRYGLMMKSFYFRSPANNRWSDRVPRYDGTGKSDVFEIYHSFKGDWHISDNCTITLSAIDVTPQLLTRGDMVSDKEGTYSWVLYPANQFLATVAYSF